MIRWIIGLIFVVGLSGQIVAAQREPAQTWGLSIGIADYPRQPKLKWADKDAIEFGVFLQYGLNVPTANYRLLKNSEATQRQILKELGWLALSAGPADRVYIFYSGHGDPHAPIVPYDSENVLSSEKLKETFRKINAREIIVFADACYSGRLADKRAKATLEQQGARGLTKQAITNIGATRIGIVLLTSANGIQESVEKIDQQNGLFTLYLMQALMAQAQQTQIDRNSDGALTLDEVYQFVHAAVINDPDLKQEPGDPKSKQEPQISDLETAKQIVLLRFGNNGPPPTPPPPTPTPDDRCEVNNSSEQIVISDHDTGLMWQQGGSARRMTWHEAREYIECLNHKHHAGYADWRLPSTRELETLIAPQQTNGVYLNPVFDNAQLWCWSAESTNDGRAWMTMFNKGESIAISATGESLYVRAVRSLR